MFQHHQSHIAALHYRRVSFVGRSSHVSFALVGLNMDEYTADAFVNRNEPIPTLSAPPSSEPQGAQKGKRDRLKDSVSDTKSKLKEKAQDTLGSHSNEKYGYSLQDRLFTK